MAGNYGIRQSAVRNATEHTSVEQIGVARCIEMLDARDETDRARIRGAENAGRISSGTADAIRRLIACSWTARHTPSNDVAETAIGHSLHVWDSAERRPDWPDAFNIWRGMPQTASA